MDASRNMGDFIVFIRANVFIRTVPGGDIRDLSLGLQWPESLDFARNCDGAGVDIRRVSGGAVPAARRGWYHHGSG